MEDRRFQIRSRLIEIENELSSIAKKAGTDPAIVLENPVGWPIELLAPMHQLVSEKLQLQKALFQLNGGSLSNVILLNERKVPTPHSFA